MGEKKALLKGTELTIREAEVTLDDKAEQQIAFMIGKEGSCNKRRSRSSILKEGHGREICSSLGKRSCYPVSKIRRMASQDW